MISFALTGDQELARDTFRSAARQLLRPAARTADTQGSINPEILDSLWALGMTQVQDDDARDPVLNSIVLEELGWGDATGALSLAGTVAVIQALNRFGSTAQKADVLPILLGNEPALAALAVAEPGFDFEVTNLRMQAVSTASGYRLNGVKTFVPLAADCRFFLVLAALDDVLEAFIVPNGHAGLNVEPQAVMGLRALRMGRLTFDRVELGPEARLGGNDTVDVQSLIDACRIGMASVLNGLSRAVYDYVSDYTRDRIAHGSALAQKQSVGFRLVDMHIAIEAMRWMNWKAASELAVGADEATRSASLAHLYACEQAAWISDEGVQLLGGHGYLKDHPVELWYRDCRTLTVLEGLASV